MYGSVYYGSAYYGGATYAPAVYQAEVIVAPPAPAPGPEPAAALLAPLMAAEVYAACEPIAPLDGANGYPLRALVRAIASMFAQGEEAVRAREGYGPWTAPFDLRRTPPWLLPFAGQAVGVRVTESTVAAERLQIEARGGWKRGRPSSLIAAIQSTLGGTQQVRLVERYENKAYRMLVVTKPAETPKPITTEQVANRAKAGGLVIRFSASSLPLIEEGTRLIEAAEGMIETATLANVTLSPEAVIGGYFTQDATQLARATPAEIEAAGGDHAQRLANQLFYGWLNGEGLNTANYGYGAGAAPEAWNGKPKSKAAQISTTSFNAPLFIVSKNPASPHYAPPGKVWFVKEEGQPSEVTTKPYAKPEEELDTTKQGNLDNAGQWDNVPIPANLPARTRQFRLGAKGTDGWATIYCPETDELWEVHRLDTFFAGEHKGEVKCGNGHYQAGVSKWLGAAASGTGIGIAAGLAQIGGMINLSDLVRVARGGRIGHALKMGATVVRNERLAPATSNDSQGNTSSLNAKGEANPAFQEGIKEGTTKAAGYIDAVPEGAWFTFPPTSRASDHGLTRPLDVAVYEAIREHGLVVTDKGSNCGLAFADPATLFTSYCDVTVNPFHGNAVFDNYVNEGTTEVERASWIDPTLPPVSLSETSGNDLMSKMPWRSLEWLKPRT